MTRRINVDEWVKEEELSEALDHFEDCDCHHCEDTGLEDIGDIPGTDYVFCDCDIGKELQEEFDFLGDII